MKKKFLIVIAACFIAALTLYGVQASKYNGDISLDYVALMAEESIKRGYPMGCDHKWEGYYCYNGEEKHCRHGGEVGAYCNDGLSVIIPAP